MRLSPCCVRCRRLASVVGAYPELVPGQDCDTASAIGRVETLVTEPGYAVAVATVGGIYGIGGGSILASRGIPITQVAPAALTCTFVTSLAGAGTFGLLPMATDGAIAPDWRLRLLLGGLAGAVGVLYLVQAAR